MRVAQRRICVTFRRLDAYGWMRLPIGDEVKDREDERLEYRQFAEARAAHLFRIAYLMCGDWHEAEDLVQDTLAKLFVAWHRIERSDTVDAYARRTLLNTLLSKRRLKRSTERPTEWLPDIGVADVDVDLRLTLVDALRRLPARSRAVIVLRYLEDHSVESVAALMGVTPGAVKSLGHRALAQLREQLGTPAGEFTRADHPSALPAKERIS